jgi:type IV pilus assembly protein PilM
MKFLERFKKKEQLLAIDIGSAYIKIAQVDISKSRPVLIKWACALTPAGAFRNHLLDKADAVGQKISDLLIKHDFERRRVALALPAPVVFTKKIKIPRLALKEVRAHVQLEASSFIPHNIDAVRLDYHIIGQSGKNQLDILVVAAKNEIINNYVNAVEAAGLELALIDVDYFALQNIFELNKPRNIQDCTALINIGARYATLTIVSKGEPICTSDIGIGTDFIKDALLTIPGFNEEGFLSIFKKQTVELEPKAELIYEQKLDYIIAECSRQLSLVWGSAAHDAELSKIYISGGASNLPDFAQKLQERCNISVEKLKVTDFFGKNHDSTLISPDDLALAGLSLGLAVRYPGDRFVGDG